MLDQTETSPPTHGPASACLPSSPRVEATPRDRATSARSLWWIAGMLLLAAGLLVGRWGLHTYRLYVVARKAGEASFLVEKIGPKWLHSLLGELGEFALSRPHAVSLAFDSTDTRAEVDRVLWCVSGLGALERVNLRGECLTDADLSRLEGLTDLTVLGVSDSRVSGEGLKIIANLPKLTRLGLNGSARVDDAALVPISRAFRLEELGLSETSVTDAGLNQLTSLKHLAVLSLDRTAVTDAGLLALRGLTSLKHLSVSQTNVTDAGIEALREALPHLEVTDD